MRWMGFSTSQSPAEVMCSVSRSHTDRTCSEIRDRFSTRAEFPQPQPLGLERVRVGGVSASNEIALLLNPDAANPTLARAALSGGAPREVLEHVRDATWAPSGDLVIVRMANGRDRLEYPVGKMLYETAGWISHPRFSKKGDRIAFLDHTAFPDTRGTVALVDLSGHKQTLTREWEDVRGLAWSAAGDEIWFTASDNGTNDFLYAVTPSGRQRLVLSVPSRLFLQDIASDGRILLVAEDVRVRIAGHAAGAIREQDLSWYDSTFLSDISAGGHSIGVGEQGAMGGPDYSVGMRKLDGSPPVRLGEGYSGGFSPDRKWVASFVNGPPPKVTLLPTGAGDPRPIPVPEIDRIVEFGVGFFPDGQHLWLNAAEAGHPARTYLQDIEGGKLHPITPEGVLAEGVSLDGKSLVGPDLEGRLSLFPTDGGRCAHCPRTSLRPGFCAVGPGREVALCAGQQQLANYGFRAEDLYVQCGLKVVAQYQPQSWGWPRI